MFRCSQGNSTTRTPAARSRARAPCTSLPVALLPFPRLWLPVAAAGVRPARCPSFDTSAVAGPDRHGERRLARRPFAEIFVRGYQDSDGDGIGDLKGLTNRLDYLKDLGVTGIWLMPITRSQDRDYGYAVSDYRNVEGLLAVLADLGTLVTQAHARGIGVVLDYVMNHSARSTRLSSTANSGSSNAFRDWYMSSAPASPRAGASTAATPWRNGNEASIRRPSDDGDARLQPEERHGGELAPGQPALLAQPRRRRLPLDAVGNLVENGPSRVGEPAGELSTLMGNICDMVGGSYANRFLVCEGPSAPLAFAKWPVAAPSPSAINPIRLIKRSQGRMPQPSPALANRLAPHRPPCRPCCPTTTASPAIGRWTSSTATKCSTARRRHLPAATRHALHLLRRGDRHARRQTPAATRSCARR